MRPSTRTAAASAVGCGRQVIARVLFCSILFAFATLTAIAQTNISPATTTVQFGGMPNADGVVSPFTAPGGGVVLTGSAISAFTGKPIRYLWVGDGNFGLCRVDPEIDVPGTHTINVNTCPFKLNGASITGGPLAFDSTTNFLYLADMRNSQGVFRMKYDPTADSGNGGIDFTSIFAMAGNPTNARFQGGQTGCSLPLNTTLAAPPPTGAVDYVALAPDGNLWVGFKKSGAIMRINNPATATSTGFGTCADFIQVVATTPDNKKTSGLVWLGHDLWGVDGTGPYVIRNADTTCQAVGSTPTTTPICVADQTQLQAAAGANSVDGDQNYPALDGDNLYFGMGAPGNDFWATNVSEGPAAQQVDPTFMSFAQLALVLPSTPAFGNESAMGVDRTDHANLVVFTGDDPSLVGALGQGRWFEACQGNPPAPGTFNCPTPFATALPGIPSVVRADAKDTSILVSWTPAQAAQPVTAYIVRNTFASNGITLADRVITPGASGFPATSASISGDPVAGVSYAFSVAEINGFGIAPFSNQSNVTPYPQITRPGIPTNVQAQAGDQAAFVTWMAPANQGGAPIVSYTVTARANNVITAIQQTVGSQGAGLNSATVPGLTNGVNYTFTVHADNGFGPGHSGMESTPSNVVVPSAGPVLVVKGTGPSTFTTSPTQLTYSFTIQNTSIFAINSVTATDNLLTGDGAFIILAQPSQGSCATGGTGVVTLVCNLGSMNSGATATVNVIVQIQGGVVTDTLNVTALDNASVTQSGSAAVTTVPPPPPSQNITATVSVTGNAQVPNPNIGQAGNIVWTVSNTTQSAAQNVVFTNNIPAGLQLNSIALTINNGGNFVCTFTPTGGVAAVCPGNFNSTLGGTIVVTTPSLGGSTKNGAKPPQTMIMTVNLTPPATTPHGAVFNSTGTMTFGPGGTDTLPNSATVKITVR
ncbi:MAG TPA: fibronectin type III domain-containing protein [Candidatus Angelobacter sp.]|nr:fibronectin type III domain-containing protein [Candidatus Angelobacter sp.]